MGSDSAVRGFGRGPASHFVVYRVRKEDEFLVFGFGATTCSRNAEYSRIEVETVAVVRARS
jgi:hypothetical protein